MKQYFYILALVFILTACNHNDSITNDKKSDTLTIKSISDTLKNEKENFIVDENLDSTYTIVWFDDSLFISLELNLIEISKKEFGGYKNNDKMLCDLDSGLYRYGECNEICEDYLVEKTTKRKLLLPTDYDVGILTMQLSPSCNQLIVCSSYDGPDFVDYYDHRAEFFVFNITSVDGLNGIKPSFKFYTKDWSIDDFSWVNDKTIALKVYEETRGDGSGLHYKYFKAELTK